MTLRIGQGFDIHRLESGDGVTLGGLWIACPYRFSCTLRRRCGFSCGDGCDARCSIDLWLSMASLP